MEILYIDESGKIEDKSQRYFVLAGISVSLKQKSQIEEALNQLIIDKTRHNNPKELELHANVIHAGRGFWRGTPQYKRSEFISNCLEEIAKIIEAGTIYKIIIDKTKIKINKLTNKNILPSAFVDIVYGCHLNFEIENKKILVISDKMPCEKEIQFTCYLRYEGLIEPPLFSDSSLSRMLQSADLIAYAIWQKNEKNNTQYYDKISHLIY